MTQYSYSQLEQLWINAGGSASLAPVMAAIAMAESGGRSDAYNASGASGIWQILGAVDPADQSNLFDPNTNAREAVLKYNSQGLGAWVTYTSGAYLQYLQGSVPPDANLPKSASGGNPQTTSSNPSPLGWLSFIGSGIIGNLLEPGQGYVGSFSNPLSPLEDMTHGVKLLAGDFAQLMTWVAWLFAPSNWLRIGAFILGLVMLGASLYMFKEAL